SSERNLRLWVFPLQYYLRVYKKKVFAMSIADVRPTDRINPQAMPFDNKRMMLGGFKVLLTALESANEPLAPSRPPATGRSGGAANRGWVSLRGSIRNSVR